MIFLVVTLSGIRELEHTLPKLDTLGVLMDSDSFLAGIPVHWHLPAKIFDSPPSNLTSTLARLRTRIAAGTDIVLPAGYSAIPHSALLPCDIELDIRWCRNHPETGRTREVFVSSPTIVFPARPDTKRKSAASIYSTSEVPLLISSQGYGELRVPGGEDVPVSIIDYEKLPRRTPGRVFQQLPVPGLIFLLIDEAIAVAAAENGTLSRTLALLASNGEARFALASTLLDPGSATAEIHALRRSPKHRCANPLSGWEIALLKTCTYSREELNRATRRMRTNGPKEYVALDSKKHFRRRSAGHAVAGGAPHAKKNRVLISDMPGDVTVVGDRIRALFETGRLVELAREETSVKLSKCASPWIAVNGNRTDFAMDSAFSFEEPEIRGLQERFSCSIDAFAEPVKLSLDAFFVDDAHQLFVYTRIAFPRDPLRRLALALHPFALTVEIPSSGEVVSSRYPDGESVSEYSHSTADFNLAWGTSWLIRTMAADLLLFLPEYAHSAFSYLPFRREKRRRHIYLTISPGGMTGKTETLAGSIHETLFGIELIEKEIPTAPLLSYPVAARIRQTYPLRSTLL